MLVNIFFTCIAKYLWDNEHNSLSFAQTHARKFVLGYDLFLKAQSFSQLGTDICNLQRLLV